MVVGGYKELPMTVTVVIIIVIIMLTSIQQTFCKTLNGEF